MTDASGFPSRATRVIFVDDDPLVRRSLRRALQGRDPDFECNVVADGDTALRHLADRAVDVLVTDMNMPSMSGRELLEIVAERHPDTVRIVLTGESDPETVYAAIPTAQQFLAKPWRPVELRKLLGRARALRRLVSDPGLRAAIGRDNELPSAPRMYMQLVDLLTREDVSLSDVADIVEQDVAMSAKVVRIAGSAYFGLPATIRTVRGAVTYLGAQTIKTLVLAVEVFSDLPARCARRFSITHLQSHSILTSHLAKEILGEGPWGEDALLGGMLHDVGKLIAATRMPDRFDEIIALATEESIGVHEAESRVLGATHADIGAYLMGVWDLPEPVVAAVARHHRPRTAGEDAFGVVGAVHVADALAGPSLPDETDDGSGPPELGLDLAYLAEMGVERELPRWRALAARLRRRHAPGLLQTIRPARIA